MTDLPDRAVVTLGDAEVGIIVRKGERSRFEPTAAWAQMPAGERPVLGQQFEEDPYTAHGGGGRFGVPTWFEHLLPERDGPLRRALARAVGVAPERAFALLLLLGDDLPGAVRVRPADPGLTFDTIARRVRDAEPALAAAALPLRVSLAGVQFKISARIEGRRVAVPGWDEDGDWIIKFASPAYATLAVNEFLTMSWAGTAGIDVPDVRLLRTAEIQGIDALPGTFGDLAFGIRRYDRTASGRIHQEDFAQVIGLRPGDAKYDGTNIDTIARLIGRLAPGDLEEFVRRLVFCVLCGNDDAHAKNWSLWYPEPTRPRLSPAYDMVSTIEYFPDNEMSLKIAGERRFRAVTLALLARLAERAQSDSERFVEVARAEVARQLEAWAAVRDLPDMAEAHRSRIDGWLARLPLVREVMG